jgi:hypothetical protein
MLLHLLTIFGATVVVVVDYYYYLDMALINVLLYFCNLPNISDDRMQCVDDQLPPTTNLYHKSGSLLV